MTVRTRDDPPMRPFRFMAAAPSIVSAAELGATARRAESMGYSGLLITDHLIEQLAPIPAMTAMAAATTTLRVGTFVLNNEFRHPAVLAQDLATVDLLSGGRLEVGIGAGWNKPEFDHIGLAFEPVPARVARLEEAVAVLKGCFADGPIHVHRRALPDHRLRRPAEAHPEAASALPDRRWRAAHPGAGRPRGRHRGAGAAHAGR